MDYKTREIPWEKVVNFHKEIASRAEESFFSLIINDESDRWTSIKEFELSNLAGPWYINNNNLLNKSLERSIKQKNITEIFIGGPCWFKWGKDNKKNFVLKCQPLLYKEVKINQLDNGMFQILPEQGKWCISPLLYTIIDKKGIVPIKPLDILIPEILEKAQSILEYEDKDLSQVIIKVLISYIPELTDDLTKEFPIKNSINKPSDWIFFTAPANFSAITQNIMSDYNLLSQLLREDKSDIGGLRLLNDVISYNNSDEKVEILPIIPLNSNQNKSVKSILGNKPVTVISGPPGCGKSQVVLSVLLNAWANGVSVLFASNNNQAVDVIKSRLEAFENDFPIAVRAGAKKVSNLEETLRRTQNILSSYENQNIDVTNLLLKQENLVREKKSLENLLDSKLPERIDQSIKSAINAYGNYMKLFEALKRREEILYNELRNIGYLGKISDFKEEIYIPAEIWTNELDLNKKIISENNTKKENILLEMQQLIHKRNELFRKININKNNEINIYWLTDESNLDKFEKWYINLKSLLNNPIEKDIIQIQWKEEFNNWKSTNEVLEWRNNAKEIEKEIDCFYKEEIDTLKIIRDAKNKYVSMTEELNKLELKEIEDISVEKLEKWINEYKLLSVMPDKKMDFLPWTNKNKKRKLLSDHEAYIISKIPSNICNIIGKLDDNGRSKLSVYVEGLYNWKLALEKFEKLKNEISRIKLRVSELNMKVKKIKLEPIVNYVDINQEVRIKDNIEKLYKISENAVIILEQKERMENITALLIKISNEFKEIGVGIPIKEAWIKGNGEGFNNTLTGLSSYIDKEDIIYLREFIYEGYIENLIVIWKELIEIQKRIVLKNLEIENMLDSKLIINNWWNKRPKISLLTGIDSENAFNNDEIISLAFNKCNELMDSCNEYFIIEPEERKNIVDELKWATNKIKDTIDILEDKEKKNEIENKLMILTKDKESWDVDKILFEFNDYNIEKLNAKIQILDSKIQEASFEIAKFNRIEKLSGNTQIHDSLENLLNHYSRNYGRINKQGYSMFKEALKAIPVWITTAQSPQAIPMEAELFDILVIDEATQCTLTNILPLIYRCKRIAVIGDSYQLPAIPTISDSAEVVLGEKYEISEWIDIVGHSSNNVYKSAVRCLPKRNSDVVFLNEHYRSHPLIIGFSNLKVYQRNLQLRWNLDSNKNIEKYSGIYGINVKGHCEKGLKNESWLNEKEAIQVVGLIKEIKKDKYFTNKSIGVVTPFKAQVEKISEILDREGIIGVTIDTVHRYQGDERDIMIFSPVVSKGITEGAIRWVENPPNLINVAVTRAKELLYVVGNIEECSKQQGILGELAKYVQTIDLLRETSKYELRLYSLMILQGLVPEVHVNINDIEVDFVIKNSANGVKIVIEVDGSQHKISKVEDSARDAFLKAKGYKVLRFSTREIDEISAEVINKIINEFKEN